MKSKEQEKSDLWELIIVLGGGCLIGAIVGAINMLANNNPLGIVIVAIILVFVIGFVVLPEDSENKNSSLKKSNKKEHSIDDRLKNKYGIKKCPICKKEIPANAIRCKYCKCKFNTNYDKKEEIDIDKVNAENKWKKCRVCGNLIPESVKNCSYCGYSNYEKPNYRVHEKIETYENIRRKELGCKKCPFCGKTILKKARKCRYCKRAL